MGDPRRFDVTAKFIATNFPPPRRVADVAGGQGNLSLLLVERGYDCSVIDPRKTALSKRERRHSRRQRLAFERIRAQFQPEMAEGFDLVVGLHPDGATEAICHAALVCPVVLVPCCKYWQGMESHGSPSLVETVRRCFRRLRVEWWETFLPMSGKRLVFVAGGRGCV